MNVKFVAWVAYGTSNSFIVVPEYGSLCWGYL